MDMKKHTSNELYIEIYSNNSDSDVNSDNSESDNFVYHEALSDSCSDYDETYTTIDIGILEKNNNDPNNNSDSTQSFPEEGKFVLSSDDMSKTDSVKSLNSQILDCSNDLNHINNAELGILNVKMRKEAHHTCTSLPKFKNETMYRKLDKNHYAENRVEPNIRNLVSQKRPMVKYPFKRKFTYNTHFQKKKIFQNDLHMQQKDVKQNKKQTDSTEQSHEESNLRNKDVITVNDNSADDLLINQDIANVKNTKSKKNESQVKYKGNKHFQNTVKYNKVNRSSQNGILHPAKLINNDKPSCVEHVTVTNFSILSPSKLTYVTAKQYKDHADTKESTCFWKHKNNNFTNKSIPLGRNVFMQNSTNSNNYREQMLHNYLQYLEFMKNIKKQKLSGTVENVDFYTRAKIRNQFLNPQCKNFNKNTLPSASTKQISEILNVKVNCDSARTSNLNDGKASTVSSTNSLFNKLDDKTIINLQIPSQSAPSDTPQCSGITLPGTTLKDLPILATKSQSVYQNASNSTVLGSSNTVPPCTVEIPPETAIPRQTLTNATVLSTVLSTQARTGSNHSSSGSDHVDHIDLNFSRPSTSTATYQVHDTNQVVAGTKKKEIYWNKKKGMLAVKFQQVYEELILIFPDVDKAYIRQMCEQYLDRESVPLVEPLGELAELILQDKELHLVKTDVKHISQKEAIDQDEKYAYLSEIFPNADPAYLKKFVARVRNNPNAITEFVRTQCEHPTYLTKEDKLQRKRITQEQMQYTSNFNVKQFLEIIPDPFTQFENQNRKCTYNSDAFQFLKFYFNGIKDEILRTAYESHMYHLTSTAEALESIRPAGSLNKNMRLWERHLSEDILLLQECAFIMYKEQIREYLDKVKEEEMKEFEKLKKGNELLQCQCCYNDECMASKCSTCTDGHVFCNSCILTGTESMLAQGKTRISCFTDCDEEFSLPTLQKILPPKQFSILVSKKQEAEVITAGLEGLISCPFCHFASIPPPEDKVFKCLNPECMKETCRFCKKLNHVPLKCYEEESNEARLFVEEKMTEALVRKCSNCSRPYFKEDGCNKISCPCGTLICYLCGMIIRSYDHFNNSACELWSKTPQINAHTVQVVAKKAIEHIKKKNPNVAINENGLLAYLPETSTTSNFAVSERIRNLTKEFDE
ncbi:E3 ubiquitin-protein ligase RNF216 [Anthophora plagiata]